MASMLYSLYEMQHSAIAPMRFVADHSMQMLRNPYNPWAYTLGGRVLAASFDLLEHTTRRYGKPEFGIASIDRDDYELEVTEEHHATKTFGRLKRFRREGDPDDPRLLLVAPMSGHFSTLLRGTARKMAEHHDVYITDWRDARDVAMFEGTFTLDDYIDYLIDWLDYLGPNTHIMAVCQPAVPVMGAVSIMAAQNHPAQPLTMTLMGGPIDTRIAPTEVNELATTRPLSWFEQNVITRVPLPHRGAMRRVYPGFLQLAGFMSMNLGDHLMKHHEMFHHLVEGDGESADATRAFYEEYRSVMDMTAEFYLQTIDIVFQRHALPDGTWVSRNRPIRPDAITKTAIMAVEGENDDISGVGQTKAALDITPNLSHKKKEHFVAPKVGHYGIFNGRRWRNTIAPEITRFIAQHDRRRRGLRAAPKAAAQKLRAG